MVTDGFEHVRANALHCHAGGFARSCAAIALNHAHDTGSLVVIGYSGGGSRATWLANEHKQLMLNLMVLYDPSPGVKVTSYAWAADSRPHRARIAPSAVSHCVRLALLWLEGKL
jgi:pimeloyl-ACP methyl ester carboxylesterase